MLECQLTLHSASIITMVRIPYVNKFENQTDLPCKPHPSPSPSKSKLTFSTVWVCHIILCSNVETGIGCFASSLPSLRHFLPGAHDGSTDPHSKRHVSSSKLITGNSTRARGGGSYRNPTDVGFSLSSVHHGRKEDNWERLQDAISEEGIDQGHGAKGIYAERTYQVDVEHV